MKPYVYLLFAFTLIQGIFSQKKYEIILDNLVNNYPPNDILTNLKTNSIFPLEINPEYDGKAKKLWENIIVFEKNLEYLKKSGASQDLIIKTEALLNKMREEFEAVKIPYVVNSIKKVLGEYLVKVTVENYLDIVIFYQKEKDAKLKLLIELIMNAIVNGVNK